MTTKRPVVTKSVLKYLAKKHETKPVRLVNLYQAGVS
jgi:hypothetical protein